MGDLEDKATNSFNPLVAIISPAVLKKDLIRAIKENPKQPTFTPGEIKVVKERSEAADNVLFKYIRRALKPPGQEPVVAKDPSEVHHHIANRMGGKAAGQSEYDAVSALAKQRGWVDMTEPKDSPYYFISEPVELSGTKREWSSSIAGTHAREHPSIKAMEQVVDSIQPFQYLDYRGTPQVSDPAKQAKDTAYAGVESTLGALYQFVYDAPDNMSVERAFTPAKEHLPELKPKRSKKGGKLGAAALAGAILGGSLARNPIGSNEDK